MINAGVSRTHLFIYTGECAATSKDQRQSRQFYSFPVLLDCHLKSGVQYCADTVLTIGYWGKKYPCFLPLSSFHSTNVSIKAHFKLPTGHHWESGRSPDKLAVASRLQPASVHH